MLVYRISLCTFILPLTALFLSSFSRVFHTYYKKMSIERRKTVEKNHRRRRGIWKERKNGEWLSAKGQMVKRWWLLVKKKCVVFVAVVLFLRFHTFLHFIRQPVDSFRNNSIGNQNRNEYGNEMRVSLFHFLFLCSSILNKHS